MELITSEEETSIFSGYIIIGSNLNVSWIFFTSRNKTVTCTLAVL